MNNTFSFKRFAMLFKKHTLEHAKMYLMSAGVLAGVLFLILGFVAYTTGGQLPPGAQTVIFILFLLFAGSIFTSLSFAALGDKRKAIPVLTLPASHFEKYLVVWIYSFIIFQLIFVGVFYLADGIVLSLCSSATNHVQVLNLFDDRYDSYMAFIIYMVLHAFAFLGAVYFEKQHFIKTSFVFFAMIIAFVFVNYAILSSMLNIEVLKNTPFSGLRFIENGRNLNIRAQINFNYYHVAAVCITALLLWSSAFFRLKEKEV
jgi:hypothetical protein